MAAARSQEGRAFREAEAADAERMREDAEAEAKAEAVADVQRAVDKAIKAHGDDAEAALAELTTTVVDKVSTLERAAVAAVLREILPAYLAARNS